MVLTIGTFDLLHYGHVGFLKEAAKLGDYLVVGVNSDRFTATYKHAPIMTYDERCHAIGQLGYRTLPNDSHGSDLIDSCRPRIVAVGSDWARKDYLAQIHATWTWLESRGITLAYVPRALWQPISSSEIRQRVIRASLPDPEPLDITLQHGKVDV